LFDILRLDHFIRGDKNSMYKKGRSLVVKPVYGWMDVKAILRIAYSNKK
jgi:hypothetical protein